MIELSAEQITSNWDKFLNQFKSKISGDRQTKLLDFYNKYEDRFALMPASGKLSFHNAIPGGYVDHVLRVHELSIRIKGIWELSGAMINFTDEELSMVALNHDLGKFGSDEHEYYVPNDSKWHVERGEVYKHNPDLQFMKTSERSLFLLQQLGIPLTQIEYLGIKLHDGLYEDGNKGYYMAFSEEFRLRSNLPYIVHQADLLATRIEHDGIQKIKTIADLIEENACKTNPEITNASEKASVRVTSTKVPGVDMKQVIPSKPNLVKENSAKPKNKYSSLLETL